MLLTTQYLDEADHLADQMVIIDQGRAIAHGTPAELKTRAGHSVIEVHIRDRRDVADVGKALTATGTARLRSTSRLGASPWWWKAAPSNSAAR